MTIKTIQHHPTETHLAQPPERIAYSNAGTAHDLINYLSVVSSYITLLRMDRDPSDQRHRALTEASQALEKCLSLARTLHDLSRTAGHSLRPLCVNDVIATMEDTLRVVAGQGTTLTITCAPDAGLVWADPQEIERVLLNLVVNARQALSATGRITVCVANAQVDEVKTFAVDSTSYVVISVSDTGSGMDKETCAHCFEPLFTTRGEGHGLGLTIVHDIVARSHGHIQIDSEPGRGTTFKVYLPRIDTNEIEGR